MLSERGFESNPNRALSRAFSRSNVQIIDLLFLAARIAASFKRFAKSAPVNPGVLLAMLSKVKSSSNFLFLE